MMQDHLPNGASVSRYWTDGKSTETELLGIFQYQTDAESFAQAKITEDAAREFRSTYVIACTYSGRVKVFAPKMPTVQAGDPAEPRQD